MLLLLPPSEGKATPPAGPPADLDLLAFSPVLGPIRDRLVRALDPGMPEAPAAPAAEVYTGVLFARLDLATLPPRDAGREVLIASGLWGLVRPADRIPVYKLPITAKVPRLRKTLPALWKPAIAKALQPLDTPGELVVDCRSGGYAAVWRPTRAAHLAIRPLRVNPDGSRQAISHNAKAARGDVARALLRASTTARTPQDVADIAARAGHEIELTGAGVAWTLDVLER
ncbi:MAG: hypothetical protein JWP17_2020 [Solirubrobacterales bacterium]|jgi:cytoplasmic iron level regulating protein YaaA (DUF328/UPF0246 family)|nr:hypothetical protein [Solirubrobacterales bacterium]